MRRQTSTMMSSVIPVIDLSDPDVDSVAAQIGSACESVGFFAVVNHGVDDPLIDRAFMASRRFFDLPDDDKLRHASPNESEYPYGYERSENLNRGKRSNRSRDAKTGADAGKSNDDDDDDESGENPDVAPHQSLDAASAAQRGNASAQAQKAPEIPPRADRKETFSIGPSNPRAGMPPRRIPSHPPELSDALQRYYEEMERLAARLLRLFARALHLPSDGWFEPLLTHHLSALRILNYYEFQFPTDSSTPSSQVDGDARGEPLVRAGEHTDYGALTILRSGGPGLQLRKDGPTAGRGDNNNGDYESANGTGAGWVNVPEIPGAFIINIGDMMQRWTNDKWVSTLHRVVVDPSWFPTGDDGQTIHVPRRQSMAYFCQVNGDATIAPMESCGYPPKYPPITAREHIMNKHLASMGVHVVVSAAEGRI